MLFLGIDTSAKVCSVALINDSEILFSKTLSDGLTHSETLLPLIKRAFDTTGFSVKDLAAIGISCGPGSFTGLRIGISTVKGLAVGLDIPCVSVSTLEALAFNGISEEGALVCALMDARRGEYYNAVFRVAEGKLSRVTEDRAIPGDLIFEEIKDSENLLILGDGAEKFVSEHPELSEFLAEESIRFQSGVSVAKVSQEIFQKMVLHLVKNFRQST